MPAWPQDGGEQVVVTGSVKALRTLDAPFAITTIDAQELRSAGPMVNLSEALARVPGLVVGNRHNYAQDLQIASRGFGARATFGVRGLRLYSDGIPATMPDGQGQVGHFDLAGTERVEVLRGPFSVLYGNASGGVIALQSAAVKKPQVEVALDGARFGLAQGRGAVSLPLGQGFDVRASAALTEVEGFRPQAAAHRSIGNLRFGWQGGADRVVLQVSDHAQRADDPLGLTWAQFDTNPRQTTSQATQFDTRKTIRQTQLGLSWRHMVADGSAWRDWQAAAYAGQRGVTQWLAIAPGTQANPRHGGGVIDFDRAFHGVQLNSRWQWNALDLVAGVNAESQADDRRGYENFTGSGNAQVLGVTGRLRRDERNRADTREAFGQLRWQSTPQVDLSGGLRAGRVSMSTRDAYLSNGDDSGALRFSFTNPVVGLRWVPAVGWAVHASVARGHESPTLGELAYRPDGGAGFNTALKAQTSRQAELGLKHRGPGWQLDLALFQADTANEIGVQTNSAGRATFQNVGRTRRAGAEASMAWQALPTLRLQASASVLRARYQDRFLTCTALPCNAPSVVVAAGNRIAGTQRGTAWAEAAWRPGLLPGEVAVEWRAQARTLANDTNTEAAPGHAVWNLRWGHRLPLGAGQALEWLARVDNAGDKVHAATVIVNDTNSRFYEPGAPRSVLLSLRWVQSW
ncbi:MAG: TonB-dependent receptor family protein [Aquabacterium sp.]